MARTAAIEPEQADTERAALARELRARLGATHEFLAGFPLARGWVIVLAAVCFGAVLISSHFTTRVTAAIDVLFESTDGWISAMLVYPALSLALMWIALGALGRLRARDVGWRGEGLLPALLATAFVWCGAQGSLLLLGLEHGFSPDLTWSWRGRASVLGAFFSQLLGNALAEETLMRGILLPQVYLRLARVVSHGAALAGAVVLNLALAVGYHVPGYSLNLAGGELLEGLWFVFWFSAFMAAVFLVTRNLFACVGLHALWNVRPTMFEVAWQLQDAAWWAWTALLLLAWALRRPRVDRSPDVRPRRA
jgi:membrane protease YdiL (CAAX protease family)